MKRKRKRKRRMAENIKTYLATLKRAKSFGPVDRKEHEAIKRYHGVE